MAEPNKPQPANPLNIDYSERDKILLTHQDSLRKLVGILGVMLPVLLFVFLWADSGYTHPMESISHYYMTRACGVFVIIVSLLAIFLLVYKGQDPIDFYMSSLAGIFALCLLLFPTGNIGEADHAYSVTTLKVSPLREHFHYISAAIFLGCLAYMSLFIFTKSSQPPELRTREKKKRNRLYRTCGVIMLIAILTILAGFLGLIPEPFYTDHHMTFWMEVVAVESFGISWLVKGGAMLSD